MDFGYGNLSPAQYYEQQLNQKRNHLVAQISNLVQVQRQRRSRRKSPD